MAVSAASAVRQGWVRCSRITACYWWYARVRASNPGNLTGSASAISITGYSAAVVALMRQVRGERQPITRRLFKSPSRSDGCRSKVRSCPSWEISPWLMSTDHKRDRSPPSGKNPTQERQDVGEGKGG